ncbi:MAG: proton-conducting transporter membrane subunit [Pirellulaceae bacterium]
MRSSLLGWSSPRCAGTIETLFFGWELVGLSSALLIAYFHERENPVRNGASVVDLSLGRCGFFDRRATMHKLTGGGDFGELMGSGPWPEGIAAIDPYHALVVGSPCSWRPPVSRLWFHFQVGCRGCMEGPTPSSAVFYGSLSVHLGAYLLLRVSPILDQSTLRLLVIAVGVASALFGAMMSRTNRRKTSLAYASLTQVGIIVVEIGCGLRYLALIHIIGHASLRTMQLLRSHSTQRLP